MTDDIVARQRGPYEWLTCRQFQHTDMATGDDAPFEAADEIERLRVALRSIAANACCDSCREAALVARAALEGEKTND